MDPNTEQRLEQLIQQNAAIIKKLDHMTHVLSEEFAWSGKYSAAIAMANTWAHSKGLMKKVFHK
jgi:hypothetical protein